MFPVATTSSRRGVRRQVGAAEDAVLAYHDPILIVRDAGDLIVGRSVPVRQLGGVQRVVPGVDELTGEALGKLSVYQESHAAPRGVTR